jgi:hypothetical protein
MTSLNVHGQHPCEAGSVLAGIEDLAGCNRLLMATE